MIEIDKKPMFRADKLNKNNNKGLGSQIKKLANRLKQPILRGKQPQSTPKSSLCSSFVHLC